MVNNCLLYTSNEIGEEVGEEVCEGAGDEGGEEIGEELGEEEVGEDGSDEQLEEGEDAQCCDWVGAVVVSVSYTHLDVYKRQATKRH